jgi:prepilin-type N-terminal cleavage/methylation domain-containing protein
VTVRGPGGSPAGLTLIEVLVATALFALFAAVAASGLITAVRLQADALALSARSAAFEPLLLAGADALDDLPFCPGTAGPAPAAAPGPDPSVCRRADERCDRVAGTVVCDGGPLRRVRLALAGDGAAASGWEVVAWSRVVP